MINLFKLAIYNKLIFLVLKLILHLLKTYLKCYQVKYFYFLNYLIG